MSIKKLIDNIDAAFKVVGTDIGSLRTFQGQKTSLDSAFAGHNTNIVEALNYLQSELATAKQNVSSVVTVDDSSGDSADQSKTWSSNKIKTYVDAVNDLVTALDGKLGTGFNSGATVQAAIDNLRQELATKANSDDLTGIINDEAEDSVSDKTYSASKIHSLIGEKINTRVSQLVDGAPETMDTLKEISDIVQSNKDAVDLINGKVSYTSEQSLDDDQKKQVAKNIGLGDLTIDFTSSYTTARDSVQ